MVFPSFRRTETLPLASLHSGWSSNLVTARRSVLTTSSTASPTTPVSRTTLPTLASKFRRASSPPNRERTTWSGATNFVVMSSFSAADFEEGEKEEEEGSVWSAITGREKSSESGRPRRSVGAASNAGNGKVRENVGRGGGDADDDDELAPGPRPVLTEMGTTSGVSVDGGANSSSSDIILTHASP